jgi:hypothetical protein
MALEGFETDPPRILSLIPEVSSAPPQTQLETFADVHGKTPWLVAMEEVPPHETPDLNQARTECFPGVFRGHPPHFRTRSRRGRNSVR